MAELGQLHDGQQDGRREENERGEREGEGSGDLATAWEPEQLLIARAAADGAATLDWGLALSEPAAEARKQEVGRRGGHRVDC